MSVTLLAGMSAMAGEAPAGSVNVPVPVHQRLTLGNGLTVILVPRHDVPLIACNLLVRGGARLDPPGRAGTAALAADLLTHGAGQRDAFAFADAVEGAGGSLDAEARSEAIQVHGQFLARDARLMLELLADMVQRPRFAPDEFEQLRNRRIEELKATKDSSPQSLLGSYGRALLFAGHPYGRAVGGSESSLAQITPGDITRYFAGATGADRATLVIAGDFVPAQVQGDVSALFGRWPKATQPLPALPETVRVRGRRVLLIDAPGATQTYFWLGNVGVPRKFPQRAALEISSIAFGGSFGSMLNQELRVKSGLTYGASARFARGSVAGEFAIASFTQADNTARAIELALATLARLRHERLDAITIASARSYLLGQYPLVFQTAADWAVALGDLDLYGLPESYIGRFGTGLVDADAASVGGIIDSVYPDPADLDIVLIGDAARIGAAAEQLGPVSRMALADPDFAPPASAH
jgi:predicted Zn-dependent peptidase